MIGKNIKKCLMIILIIILGGMIMAKYCLDDSKTEHEVYSKEDIDNLLNILQNGSDSQ